MEQKNIQLLKKFTPLPNAPSVSPDLTPILSGLIGVRMWVSGSTKCKSQYAPTVRSWVTGFTLPYVITLFFFITALVYGNALFNDFVADDKSYILNDPITQIVNIALWFGKNSFNDLGQYRPLQPAYFSILYSLFGTTPFPYHVFQILLHVFSTTLLYVLFRKILSSGIALFFSLVFLIHPMNVESVAYIAQTASPLFFLLGIIPLLLSMRKNISVRMLTLIFSLLLLSMFEKETGILFLFLILLYAFLFAKDNMRRLLPGGFIILAVYAFFRFFIGHISFETRLLTPIASLSLPERLLNVPIIMFYYIKTFFFPKTLAYNQLWVITSINFSTFYLPLILDLAFFTIICLSGLYIFKCHKNNIKPFLFYSVWFIAGLSFYLQIFPIDATVADRWFYFPMAGLLGLLGVIYRSAFKKVHIPVRIIVFLASGILLLLSLRTVVRNSDWENGIKLYNHDISYNDNFNIENDLGNEYFQIKQYGNALKHYQKSIAMRPYEYNLHNLGVTYENLGDIQNAKKFYELALHSKDYRLFLPHKHDEIVYKSYASLLVFYDKPSLATTFIQNAISDYPDSSDLWFLLALAKYKQHDKQGALDAASKAYQLNPNVQNTFIYIKIQNRESFSINLKSKTFIFSSF